jgi:hypothetical protein
VAVPLHHVVTLRLRQSAIDRLLGVGTIELLQRLPDGREQSLLMEDVPHPKQTYDELVHTAARAGRAHRARSELGSG